MLFLEGSRIILKIHLVNHCKVDLDGFFLDLVEENSEEKSFIAIMSRSNHVMLGIFQFLTA